jgi:hypothetical protein
MIRVRLSQIIRTGGRNASGASRGGKVLGFRGTPADASRAYRSGSLLARGLFERNGWLDAARTMASAARSGSAAAS